MPENRCRCSATCSRLPCQEKAHWDWNPDLVIPRPFPWPWALSTWDSDPCPDTSRASFWHYTSDGTFDSTPWAAAAVIKGWRARITKPSWVESRMGARTQIYISDPPPCPLFHVTLPHSVKSLHFQCPQPTRQDKITYTLLKGIFQVGFFSLQEMVCSTSVPWFKAVKCSLRWSSTIKWDIYSYIHVSSSIIRSNYYLHKF